MKRSVLIVVGSNLIYQQAPDVKPAQGNVELLKDYAYWQQSVKSYLVKEADRPDFDAYFGDENSSKNEIPIPYEIVEIYYDTLKGKNFARMRKGITIDNKTNKVVGVIHKCKVCESDIEVPIDQEQKHFPICNGCLIDLKSIVLEKRANLNLQ